MQLLFRNRLGGLAGPAAILLLGIVIGSSWGRLFGLVSPSQPTVAIVAPGAYPKQSSWAILNRPVVAAQASASAPALDGRQPCVTARSAVIMHGPVYRIDISMAFVEYYMMNNPGILIVYTHFATLESPGPSCSSISCMKEGTKGNATIAARLSELALKYPSTCLRNHPLASLPATCGVTNRHCQRIPVAESLRLIRAHFPSVYWVAKTRNDQLARLPGFMAVLEATVLARPLAVGITNQKHRLLSTSRVDVNPKPGFCHLDDQFMYGNVDDIWAYWGYNNFVDLSLDLSPFVQNKPDYSCCSMDTHRGVITTEAFFCQTWLRAIDSDYNDFRKLLTERFVVIRTQKLIGMDIFNNHMRVDVTAATLDKICVNIEEERYVSVFTDICNNFERTHLPDSGYAFYSCKLETWTYDCSEVRNNHTGIYEYGPVSEEDKEKYYYFTSTRDSGRSMG